MAMQGTFIIIRDDLLVDPVTIVAEGLLVGRLPTCELLLNHPWVSRLHAGITTTEGEYYIRNLRPVNPIMLNGTPLEQYEALTAGDVLGIGPFSLNMDFKDEALVVRVSLQIGATPGEAVARRAASGIWVLPTTANLELPSTPPEGQPAAGAHKKPPARKPKPDAISSKALDVFWDKRITAATKTIKASPLFPRHNRPSGKAQSVWISTTDLKPKSHYGKMLVIAAVIAVLAGAGAVWYAKAFAPGPISQAHSRSNMTFDPPIAVQANAAACTSCHKLTGRMDTACASCHSTDVFAATVIPEHLNAGIGCADCHAEHRGENFSAIDGALLSCFKCHNDNNKQTYKGKTVATPHGGTFGYPVANGQWIWKGLDPEELVQRKAELNIERFPGDSENGWRYKQFHALHPYRVMAVAGIKSTKDGELGCSSCHTNSRDPVDRLTPRTTCGKCHNGQPDARAGHQVIASDQPNCTSCHVQHIKDKRHWNPALLPAK